MEQPKDFISYYMRRLDTQLPEPAAPSMTAVERRRKIEEHQEHLQQRRQSEVLH